MTHSVEKIENPIFVASETKVNKKCTSLFDPMIKWSMVLGYVTRIRAFLDSGKSLRRLVAHGRADAGVDRQCQ